MPIVENSDPQENSGYGGDLRAKRSIVVRTNRPVFINEHEVQNIDPGQYDKNDFAVKLDIVDVLAWGSEKEHHACKEVQ